MQELMDKIKRGQAVCYLNLRQEDLRFWNFLNGNPPLFNTRLLFYAAARPHFDYFFESIDYLGLDDEKLISLVEDEKFMRQLRGFSEKYLRHEQVLEKMKAVIDSEPNTTLITNRDLKNSAGVKGRTTIVIDDINLFGNPEPVWRKIQARLPKSTSVFLLALGTEKFLIGPRLKLKYGVPVIDTGMKQKTGEGFHKKFKALAKKIIYK